MAVARKINFLLIFPCMLYLLSCNLDETVFIVDDLYLYNPESAGSWGIVRKDLDVHTILPVVAIVELKGNDKLLFIKENGRQYYFIDLGIAHNELDVFQVNQESYDSFHEFSYHFKINNLNEMIRMK